MRDIMQIIHLIHVLEDESGEWTREQKIEEIKRVRENKDITADEAIDITVEYFTK